MKNILVDSSVWIDFFKDGTASSELSDLIDKNFICTNDLILSEIVPFLKVNKADEVISLLYEIENIPLKIDWNAIIDFQVLNIRRGINKVGIPDLLIMQNAINNDLILYTFDGHFPLMHKLFGLKLY